MFGLWKEATQHNKTHNITEKPTAGQKKPQYDKESHNTTAKVMLLSCVDPSGQPYWSTCEGTHAYTGKTCKLHVEIPWDGIITQDHLAARQECYRQHHCAPHQIFGLFIKYVISELGI